LPKGDTWTAMVELQEQAGQRSYETLLIAESKIKHMNQTDLSCLPTLHLFRYPFAFNSVR
jgi:hypothetical protein